MLWGILHDKETWISSSCLGLWFLCTFTFTLTLGNTGLYFFYVMLNQTFKSHFECKPSPHVIKEWQFGCSTSWYIYWWRDMITKIVWVKLLHVIIGLYLLIMWGFKGVVIYRCVSAWLCPTLTRGELWRTLKDVTHLSSLVDKILKPSPQNLNRSLHYQISSSGTC